MLSSFGDGAEPLLQHVPPHEARLGSVISTWHGLKIKWCPISVRLGNCRQRENSKRAQGPPVPSLGEILQASAKQTEHVARKPLSLSPLPSLWLPCPSISPDSRGGREKQGPPPQGSPASASSGHEGLCRLLSLEGVVVSLTGFDLFP